MNAEPAEPQGFAPPPPREGWGFSRWLFFLALAVAAHFALVFLFGTKKPPTPRAVADAPQLTMVSGQNEIFALTDPTLFARPHEQLDYFPAVWMGGSQVAEPQFRWTEPPPFLAPASENLASALSDFTQTNSKAPLTLDFKPEPAFSIVTAAIESALPQTSTFQIQGDLAKRPLQQNITVPTLACNDVLPPIRVQLFVDETGVVISAVALPPENPMEAAGRAEVNAKDMAKGEANALEFARSLQFAPAAKPTLGEIIFNWHTEPTNAP
jgi:hypothetical protein